MGPAGLYRTLPTVTGRPMGSILVGAQTISVDTSSNMARVTMDLRVDLVTRDLMWYSATSDTRT